MDESLNQESAATFIEFEPRQTLAQAWRWAVTRWAGVFCAALLLGMSVQLFAVISRKNITNDELVHIPAGYYHLVAGEFQLNNEHPPLIKMWAALPLLFIQPKESLKSSGDADNDYREVTWGFHQNFWANNRSQFQSITFWTRTMMIVLTCVLGVVIFLFARDLFGRRVAVIAVALFTLEPTVLAHGRIVHTDLPALLVFVLFFFTLRRYFQARTFKRAAALGLVSGIALITKFSMIVLVPVLGLIAILGLIFARRFQENQRKLLVHCLIVLVIGWFLVNAAYRFQSPPLSPGDVKWVQVRSPENANAWLTFFNVGSRIVPTYYLYGQYNVMLHNRDGHATSLLGQYSNTGWWYYFPVAFALKTTLPFLLLTIIGLVFAIVQLISKHDWRFLWLLVPMAIYALLSMTSHINIGIRHFFPEFGFFFILAAVMLDMLLRTKLKVIGVGVVVVCFGWMTVEDVKAYPNYIPYMNEMASSHPKWWYLSDSNVEWGDEAQELANYLHARGETEVSGAMMGAWGTLDLLGIKYYELFPRPGVTLPETKYVVIGASFMNGSTNSIPPDANGKFVSDKQRVNYLAAYRTMQPEVVIGDALYVFKVK
ncbi:MAG TPA: glycosyltransferase family 39 protein [Pyrinomonadaceae bacterium]